MCFGNSLQQTTQNPGANGVLAGMSGVDPWTGVQSGGMTYGKDPFAVPHESLDVLGADRFRQYSPGPELFPGMPAGGDVTLGTDIPGNWSPQNILPGTDPGMASWHDAKPAMQMLLDYIRGANR